MTTEERYITGEIFDLLGKETTKIAKAVLNELNRGRLRVVAYRDVYWYEYNFITPPTERTRNYLKRFLKRKFGLTHLYDKPLNYRKTLMQTKEKIKWKF